MYNAIFPYFLNVYFFSKPLCPKMSFSVSIFFMYFPLHGLINSPSVEPLSLFAGSLVYLVVSVIVALLLVMNFYYVIS